MSELQTGDTRVFGADKGFLISFAVLFGPLAAFFVSVEVKCGRLTSAWTMLAVFAACALVCVVLARAVRLEIGPNGLRHRTAIGTRALDYGSLTRAYIDVLRTKAPQGCATLCLESREGRETRIHLRHYPIEAAVALFDALESRSIRIEEPDSRAAGVARSVRAARARMAK